VRNQIYQNVHGLSINHQSASSLRNRLGSTVKSVNFLQVPLQLLVLLEDRLLLSSHIFKTEAHFLIARIPSVMVLGRV
jgi:hypothetical protein